MMKKIVLFLGVALIFSAWQIVSIKDYTITGKVIDVETKDPLIACSVTLKGTTRGVITDIDGIFQIKAKKSCVEVEVSYTGYQTKKVKICKEKKNIISLTPVRTLLDEVVVEEFESPKIKIRGSRKERSRIYQDGVQMQGVALSTMPSTYIPPEPAIDFNTEDYDHIAENRFYEAMQTPLSTFSIDVDAASYSNMRRFIQNGQQPPKDAIRIEEMVNYFNYDYEEPKGKHPFKVYTELSDCPWQAGHKLVHIGLQGKRIPTKDLPASNLIFLIDVSGSMNAANKLPLLQSSFKLLTDQLRPQDRVALVVYAGAAGLVLPSTSGQNKQKIKEAIQQLKAGGSTAGGEGIKLAYSIARQHFIEGGNNRVILATDGDFNVGASSDAAMVRLIEEERKSGVFLTVLGFGMGNYKDNKMQQLANKGNGNHAYIDNIKEAKKVLVNEFGGTMFTIAKDVKIQIEFNPAKVKGYRLIGYENRMLKKEDFNDDQKDAGELGSGHTVTALYEIIPVGVNSPFLAAVDELKYQQSKAISDGNAKELMNVKLRYKAPNGDKSQLIEQAVLNQKDDLNKSSENFRWAASVAAFGMLLRDSEFKGKANYMNAIQLAKTSKGADPNGYRQELIDMMETMRSLADPDLAGKE